MSKKRLWLISTVGITALLGVILVATVRATTFYKPNRGARLIVYLKAKAHYERLPVTVTVMLANQTDSPVLYNSRMKPNTYPADGELSFIVEGPDGKQLPLVKPVVATSLTEADLSVMNPGETSEQTVDLTDLYGIRKDGRYRIQALYYNTVDLVKNKKHTWRGVIASEQTEIHLD